MKLVTPFTPSSVDGVSSHGTFVHKAVEQPEDIPESIFALLWATAAMSGGFESLPGGTALLLSEAWPTIWIWVKYIYHANLRDLPSVIHNTAFARRYTVIVAMLGLLAKHGDNQLIFEIVLNHESDILPMMADMWKGEGTDKNLATQGFQCGIFPSTPAPQIQQKFIAQVIATCGTAQEAVHVACQRVERHLEQKHRGYEAISLDLYFFTSEMMQIEPSPLMQPMYASSSVAIMLMHSWNHITSISFTDSVERRNALITTCMGGAVALARSSPQAPNRISDMLHQDLLRLLAKSISLVQKSSPHHHTFREGIVSPATVHREILSLIRRCVAADLKRGDLRPLATHARVRDAWSELQKQLYQREMSTHRYFVW
ncbi:hypothetical protein FIBSPDRAFT_868713 [Athelia psychrophila]|uniref:Uncharacterized protein n=1 Tax=Athelia psychrophila TaxID=1759441 RepID=A0A166CTM9_9AGAM|nr:hypothetical protein FIBSPDRAFT_868713 [Fibularhizoctonia sp. CBS 109695]